jgi:chromosome partitioning protein
VALIVAFTNTKGGVSKSTLASHLAIWLHDKGIRVSLLDADGKQDSSATWIRKAGLSIPVAVACETQEIQTALKDLASACDVVVADTPGHANDASQTVTLLCDIAVVPLQASKLDLWAIKEALKFVFLGHQISGGLKPDCRILLTKTAKRDIQARRLRSVLKDQLSIPVMKSEMRALNAFRDSPESAVTRMKGGDAINAATDIEAIFHELLAGKLPGIGVKLNHETAEVEKEIVNG